MPEPTQASTAPVAAQTPPPSAPGPSPQQIYRALQSQREVLGDQLSEANQLRNSLVNQMGQGTQSAATKASIEKRIASVDEHITNLDQQIAKSDLAVAQAAAVPGATVRPPSTPRSDPDPDMVAGLSFALAFVIAIPITIAFARRIWRRSAKAEVRLSPEMVDRMDALERGVEAIALEVERIGEGQRFVTQALTERGDIRAIAAGAPEPVSVRQRERADERR